MKSWERLGNAPRSRVLREEHFSQSYRLNGLKPQNEKTKDKVFRKSFHVHKGNNPIEFEEDLSSEIFQIISSFYPI
jgi:hypothetical protein